MAREARQLRSRKPALSEAEGDPLPTCATTSQIRHFYHGAGYGFLSLLQSCAEVFKSRSHLRRGLPLLAQKFLQHAYPLVNVLLL